MSVKQFTFEELAAMDGQRIAIAVNQALKRAAEDCFDLPGEKRPRKVVLQIELAPQLDERGNCDGCECVVQIKQTMPTRKTKPYDFGLRANGVLTYNPESLDSIEQQTFDYGAGDDD